MCGEGEDGSCEKRPLDLDLKADDDDDEEEEAEELLKEKADGSSSKSMISMSTSGSSSSTAENLGGMSPFLPARPSAGGIIGSRGSESE